MDKARGAHCHWIADRLELSLEVRHRLCSMARYSYLPCNLLASYSRSAIATHLVS